MEVNMKKLNLIMVLLLSLTLVTSCSKGTGKSEKPSGDVVGKVGDEYITWKEFKEQLDSLPQYYRQFLQRGNAKVGFLKKQLIKKAMVKEAESRGYDKDPKIQSQLKRMREQLLVRKLMEAERNKKYKVSDDEIKKYYDEHKNEFEVKDEVKIKHIMIKLPKNATKKQQQEALAKIKKAQKELKSGKSFEEVVKKYSEDRTTKMSKGELPFFSKNRKLRNYMDKTFVDAAFSLKRKGDISGIVKTEYGYHIIKLIDRHEPRVKDFIEVAPQIKRKLEEQKRISQRKQLEENLEKKYGIKIYEDVLKKVSSPSTPKSPVKIKKAVPTKQETKDNGTSKSKVNTNKHQNKKSMK